MTDAPLSRVTLSCGDLELRDTGGSGPVVVLLHGLLMDESLWGEVVDVLSSDFRCIVPVLPLGAHRVATRPEFAVTPTSVASIVSELLERLDVRDVTLVGNDTGGAVVQILAARRPERVGRIVLVSCDAFDNFPPGLTGKTLVFTGLLPPRLFGAFMQQLRFRVIRRLPIAFGWLSKRGDAATQRWLQPVLHNHHVREDTVAVLRAIRRDRQLLERTADALANAAPPALVVWADGDRVMPLEHAHRLAQLLNADVVVIPDSYTLIPLDQPHQLAAALRTFAGATRSAF